jgi:hypothetical protein
MKERTGCHDRNSAIRHAKEEMQTSEDSPISQLEKELIHRDLISRYRKVVEPFSDMLERNELVFGDKVSEEFRMVTNEIHDVAARFGIPVAFYNIHNLLGKMEQRHQDVVQLHSCPCCKGSKIHANLVREGKNLIEETDDCSTCNATGRLDF